VRGFKKKQGDSLYRADFESCRRRWKGKKAFVAGGRGVNHRTPVEKKEVEGDTFLETVFLGGGEETKITRRRWKKTDQIGIQTGAMEGF